MSSSDTVASTTTLPTVEITATRPNVFLEGFALALYGFSTYGQNLNMIFGKKNASFEDNLMMSMLFWTVVFMPAQTAKANVSEAAKKPKVNTGVTKAGTKTLKPLGLGSTGRTRAANLTEQLAMEEAMANPAGGKIIMPSLKDSRWPGWSKMQYIHKAADGTETTIHYNGQWVNGALIAVDDFKFK
jgi:hypothetical protein